MVPPFRWDAGAARWRRANGSFIPDPLIQSELERVLLRGEGELRTLAARYQRGTLTLDQWHIDTRLLLRDLHLMAAAVASGGAAQMTAAARGQVGGRLRIQYAYLDRLAGSLAAGLPPDAAFVARAVFYIRAVRVTYLKALSRVRRAAGYTIQRNRLRPADHCGECQALTGAGWVPIGSQPDPGDRECGPGCQCYYEYARALPPEAAQQAALDAEARGPLPPIPTAPGLSLDTMPIRVAIRYLLDQHPDWTREQVTAAIKAVFGSQYRTGMVAAEAKAVGHTFPVELTRAPKTPAAPVPVPPPAVPRGGRHPGDPSAPGFGFARPAFAPAVTLGEARQRLETLLGVRKLENGGASSYAIFRPFQDLRTGQAEMLEQVNVFLREAEYLNAKYGIPASVESVAGRGGRPTLGTFVAGRHESGMATLGGGFSGELAIGDPWPESSFIRDEENVRAGGRRWTFKDQTLLTRDGRRDTRPSTARHELGHTFSGSKAEQAWLNAKARAQQPGTPRLGREWFAQHVSDYAASDDWWEQVSETASTVSSAEYIPGTLPAALEDYVARLYRGEFF